ncbi:MAG: choice-of-anchor V domain-containing protein [Myxococcota bacterium]
MRLRRHASVCVFATMVATGVSANSWNVGPGSTGAPQDAQETPEGTCVTCHATAALNPDADARLELQGLPEHYLPGVRYTVTLAIEHADADRLRWGFALTAVAPERPGNAGRLIATDRQNTRLLKGERRAYLVHTYPGTAIGRSGGQRWTFDWVAPLSDVGEIAFFTSVVAADADGTEHGDLVYGPTPAALAVTAGPSAAREAAAEAEAEPDAEEPAADSSADAAEPQAP